MFMIWRLGAFKIGMSFTNPARQFGAANKPTLATTTTRRDEWKN
jgi:hypothetical protein